MLAVGVLACLACLLLTLGGVAYWFFSLNSLPGGRGRHHPTRQDVEQQADRTTPEFSSTNDVSRPSRRPSTAPPKTVPAQNAILASQAGRPSLPGDDIFRDLVIPDLEIEIPMQATVRLSINPRTYLSVTIHEGERVYTNVALRLKGGPGSFQRLQETPSLTVNFDKFAPGQTFHGLKKIHLNSSVQDRTCLNEKISRELFEAAGVPVPRAGHAIVTLNRRDPRLYVLLEGVNKQFLKRYFKDAKGNVYDGHSGTDVTDALPVNSGEENRDRLRDLAAAAREPDLELRLQKLEKTLDLDRFLSFVAMEMMVSHWDGYTQGRNNYRIAHDRDTDRMVFVPHGMDQVFGESRQHLLMPKPAGLVARAVLEIPEERKRYRDRLAELATNVFRPAAITNRVREVAESIAGALEEIDPQSAKSYRERIAPAYCKKIQVRAAYCQREINSATQPHPAKFDESADATLTNWTPKTDQGDADLRQEKDEHGQSLLYIGTTSGCTASWRTTAVLEKGHYRFEARIKTKGVVLNPADQRAGAGLRTSRHRTGQKNAGDLDWTPIHFDFDVTEDETDKELICELRANKGEIWYDLNSLKLKRL